MHVILVPGFWLDASAWDAVLPPLRAAGHELEPITRRGLESRDTDRSGITLDDQVAAVVERIDAVPTDTEVALVGHSGGGPVAYLALDKRPERVDRIVYVDSFPGPEGGSVNDELPVVDGEVPLPDWSIWDPPTVRDMTAEIRADMERRAIPEPAAVPAGAFHYTDERRHRVPTTMITCEMTPDEIAGILQARPSWASELSSIEALSVVGLETGHWPMFTKPSELGALLVDALH
jgi:pimeloyl-ACP methyl ester carboxylesterase